MNQELPHTLGSTLKNVIGPYGLEIIGNFQFRETDHRQNFYILLKKLDIFFYLRLFPRMPAESINEYKDRLLPIATGFGIKYPDVAVKEKITFDLKTNHFLEKINGLVIIRNRVADLKLLNMNEIIFLVSISENYDARKRRDDFLIRITKKRCPPYNVNCCGRNHSLKGICRARGQRCWKCDGLNHFAKICKRRYIRDCVNCGINHAENKCDAFGKGCSRCGGLNHFHWKCLPAMRVHCPYCGSSHADIGRRCLAFARTCSNCQRVGHFSSMCRSRRRR